MLIGFIGDVHGRVLQTIAAIITWQRHLSRHFDILIQVGDLGAFPNSSDLDPASHRYAAIDPSEADFSRLLKVDEKHISVLGQLRRQFNTPIYFIRGNHEDFTWLDGLRTTCGEESSVQVDPYGFFRYVPDGTVLEAGGLKIGFLGGVEERSDAAGIDQESYSSLISLGPNILDILVTHEGPYGSSRGYRGDIHGSRLISELVSCIKPRFHVAGHAHSLFGPERYGDTIYLGLDGLIASPIWYPNAEGLQPGCFGLLDTTLNELCPTTDPWLGEFPKLFDFDRWLESC